jgi:3-phytase
MLYVPRLSVAAVLAAAASSAWLAGCDTSTDKGSEPGSGSTVPMAAAETPNESDPADVDDPAVWVHPGDASKTLIVTTAKRGGMRVYDLSGRELQRLVPPADEAGEPSRRYNNVDIQYGFNLNGTRVDLAVASDRVQDKLSFWKIDPADPKGPLVDLTDPALTRLFPTRPDHDDLTKTVDNPDDGENTAYGLTLWRDKASDKLHVLVNQNDEAVVAQYEVVANADGTVGATFVRSWLFPYSYKDQSLTETSDDDPRKDYSPQFEGMVVDQQTGTLYAGQEDVGIWRVDLKTGEAEDEPFYETSSFDPASKIARDVEGLAIYYAANGKGYLLASSQGNAHGEPPVDPAPGLDDTFVVFSRDNGNGYLGSFSIHANPAAGIDAVQECDGADVTSVSLPGYPYGLLITQDGYNDDLDGLDGTTAATNFKLTPWERIAGNFPGGELLKDTGYDPRNP